jgi:hypothetical protein
MQVHLKKKQIFAQTPHAQYMEFSFARQKKEEILRLVPRVIWKWLIINY